MVTASFGVVLTAVGLLLLRSHRSTWTRQQVDPGLNQEDRNRLRARYRRRMQMSGMIVVLGLMLGVGDAVIWEQGLVVATIYWIAVVSLGGWLLLLGMGDLASVRVDSRRDRDELRQIGARREELEAELAEVRRRRSNGEATSDGRH